MKGLTWLHTAVVPVPPGAVVAPTDQITLTIGVPVTVTISYFAKASSLFAAALFITFLLPPDIISRLTYTKGD